MLSISERIIFEDNHLLVINKLPGELSQKDKTGDDSILETVGAFIKERDKKPGNVFLGLVHRLDRPTSGLLVLAKTSKALERMNAQFSQRTVKKIYWAITDAGLASEKGELVHYIVRNEKNNTAQAFDTEMKHSQIARLSYQLVGKGDRYFAYAIDLHTGRHHQIRAQFKASGVHIKGDLKYGAKRSNQNGGISLHAGEILFDHPTLEKQIHLRAEPSAVQEKTLWEVFNFPSLLLDQRSS